MLLNEYTLIITNRKHIFVFFSLFNSDKSEKNEKAKRAHCSQSIYSMYYLNEFSYWIPITQLQWIHRNVFHYFFFLYFILFYHQFSFSCCWHDTFLDKISRSFYGVKAFLFLSRTLITTCPLLVFFSVSIFIVLFLWLVWCKSLSQEYHLSLL